MRPWYSSEDEIGGLIMHTGDITHIKNNEDEKIRIEKILENTNEIARIGIWEVDLLTNKVYWSKVVYEIHEVSNDFVPDVNANIGFYKEGKNRDLILKALKDAIENGIPFDLEVEIETATEKTIWARSIGQPKMVDGKCVRLAGMFQDINKMKVSQLALNKANVEMNAILNSSSVAIISTDNDGIINHFNRGAEELLGYSALEVIGNHSPVIFHLKDEIDSFQKNLSELPYNFNNHQDSTNLLNNLDFTGTREWTYRRKNGSTFPVELTVTAINNNKGERIGFIGIFSDITERKKAQNELIIKNQLLNFAEEITKTGHWQWDIVNDRIKWSNNLFNIFEIDNTTSNLKFDTYLNFVHPDDKVFVTTNFQNAIYNNGFENFNHRIKTNGKTKTIQLIGKVFKNEKGIVTEIIGTCQDVTEQKMAENKFRGLLESAPDAMVIVNEKGCIQLINKQAEKLFGYTLKEIFDKPVEILIPKRFTGNNAHIGLRDFFFAKPKVKAFGVGSGKDLFGVNKEGKEIPIQISLSPLQTEEGLLVSAAIRDITTQKLASRKILEAKENLEVLANKLTAQNTQLADFVHITSHNLRAPVSNLNSLLEFYNTSESDEEKEILFEKFEKVINHLTLTLNTLIEALRTKSDSTQDLEQVLFSEVMHKTQEILSGEILESGIAIITDFSQVSTITYNTVYLESIFLNLVSNAIKYRAKDKTPEIFIKSEIIDKKIILSFKDNGLGIDLMRNGHKLFGLNKVFHRHPDAKGVDLFMTKIQVEAMGGTITAKSKVNEGSTFTINFN